MSFYVSKPVTDYLLDYIKDNFHTYIATKETESGIVLKDFTSVARGGANFERHNKTKPFCLLEPQGIEVSDELPYFEATVNYDVLIAIDGFQDTESQTLAELYQDAFIDMIIDDDTLGGQVTHVTISNVEQYPGGTGSIRYVVLALAVTIQQGR